MIAAGAVLLIGPAGADAQPEDPVAWWDFQESQSREIMDRASGIRDSLSGNFRYRRGIRGDGLKFDGYTTVLTRSAESAPRLDNGFTLEAWVAVAAFPWNWCGLIGQSRTGAAGYALEIGPDRTIALRIFAGGEWRSLESETRLPWREWCHVAATFAPGRGMRLYIDGREAGREDFPGRLTSAPDVDLLIGSPPEIRKPGFIHRDFGTLPGWYSIDALIDEVKIFDRPRDPGRIAAGAAADRPKSGPGLPLRRLPSGPEGPGRFGAYATHLRYYWEWDDLWRVSDFPDIVVRFSGSPVRMVFWRGTRYSPAWVTENNLWMADQSVEAWNDEQGCFEHMQDAHCRYSHVRILENTSARILVHWRYAPVSAHNMLWRVDERTGRGCMVDEYYYIYPDQTAVRKVTWKTGTLGHPRQFQESIPLTGPGQTQGDVIHDDYVAVANLDGETRVFRYVDDPSGGTTGFVPEEPLLQRHNLRAENKPFIIFEPGSKMNYLKDMNKASLARSGSCSHWPVGQMRCDGRTQRFPDRAASFLGFPITDPPVHEDPDGRSHVNSLYGMGERPMAELVELARSWLNPPKLTVEEGPLTFLDYDRSQRAYVLEKTAGEAGEEAVRLSLAASAEAPLVNACLIIRRWDRALPRISVTDVPVGGRRKSACSELPTLDGRDLAIWVPVRSRQPVEIRLEIQSKER